MRIPYMLSQWGVALMPGALGARLEALELLDRPSNDPADLAGNLADLRQMNALLGWSRGVARAVEDLARRHQLGRFSLLDVATGSADIPITVVRQLRRRGWEIDTTASDLNRQILDLAAGRTRGTSVRLVRHDALAPPFRPGSFDIVSCCLAIHHFGPEAATLLLREMASLARAGIVVADLERSRLAYFAAVAAGLVARSPLTRHDGPLSVRRAYRVGELLALAQHAGLTVVTVQRQFPFRLVLTADALTDVNR